MQVKSLLKCMTMFVVMLGLTSLGSTVLAAKSQSYLLTTGTTGGTYYPVGVAISTLVKVKLLPKEKIRMSAINSAGSGENIKLLSENEAQLGIVSGLFGYYAWTGKGAMKSQGPQKNLRAISMLWQNVEHFTVLSKYAKTGTIEDILALKGHKMALGKKNSGAIGSNREITKNLGLDMDKDFDLVFTGYGPSADALQNGRVSGMSTAAGVPVSAVSRVIATMGKDATLLEFTPEQAKIADGGLNLWTPYTIPAGSYPNQDVDIQTIAQPNMLIVRADASEDDIYKITKTIYENLPFLQSIHKATKAMSIEKAIAGLTMPLHKGAMRYYKEVGLAIPDHLME